MSRRPPLFAPPPRQAPRFLMHVCDAGINGPGPGMNAQFRCKRCGSESEWQPIASVTDAKRGIPCPTCN